MAARSATETPMGVATPKQVGTAASGLVSLLARSAHASHRERPGPIADWCWPKSGELQAQSGHDDVDAPLLLEAWSDDGSGGGWRPLSTAGGHQLQRSLRPQPPPGWLTHTAVSPRAADGCIARIMREPIGARLTTDAALLLWKALGCWLPRSGRRGHAGRAIASPRSERLTGPMIW